MDGDDLRVWRARSFRVLAALAALSGVGRSAALTQSMPQTGPAPARPSPTAPLALHGVTVIDVRTGRLVSDQTVVIVGRHIQAVGPVSTVRVPAGA